MGLGSFGCIKHEQPLHVDMLIPSEGWVTTDQFVEWVFLADDMNPDAEKERWQPHKAAIRTAFIECLGGEVMDVSTLRWSSAAETPTGAIEKLRGPLA